MMGIKNFKPFFGAPRNIDRGPNYLLAESPTTSFDGAISKSELAFPLSTNSISYCFKSSLSLLSESITLIWLNPFLAKFEMAPLPRNPKKMSCFLLFFFCVFCLCFLFVFFVVCLVCFCLFLLFFVCFLFVFVVFNF